MNLVNGVECEAISLSDRGLHYGDGVFRTFTLRGGKPVLWQRQFAKLAADCRALRIACPDTATFESDLSLVATHHADCVVKIIVTRGNGPRGYAIPATASAQRVVSSAPLPDYPQRYYDEGVRVRVCNVQLASQPLLAGIKHLNRLENVLARSEWNDANIAEGLMRDAAGSIVCGTMSNLFLVKEGVLSTPDLTHCGVAGATRALVIELACDHHIQVQISTVSMAQVLAADELFLVNSVIGVWRVAALEQKNWGKSALTAQIREWLSDAQKR